MSSPVRKAEGNWKTSEPDRGVKQADVGPDSKDWHFVIRWINLVPVPKLWRHSSSGLFSPFAICLKQRLFNSPYFCS